ncbi:hypothetical protein K3148_02320 [Qipengyuania aurantiaca]|uniref:Uncharacterized protein n=1 Tax=Qipengyuania aurantiaca TaxID=2867233 RepID=A0ABX8ZMT9_9SPHN|nr:hypothetical protein [Qipengyuania aurantiaca]QZD90261.1 hypothetical protein K3148_02320 [Qipengyuania aurantiaca]
MSDYETPKVPPATPPVIDPDVAPKTAAEMEADGETEGDVLADKTEPDDIDVEAEQAIRPAMDGGRGGEGEQALDAATMLPPD